MFLCTHRNPNPGDGAFKSKQTAADIYMESWVLALRNRFKNMRKKTENCSEEMAAKKRQYLHKRHAEATSEGPSKMLCRLFDCDHLVVYGETAETLQKHNEWLHENVACEDEDQMRPRLLATAEERHQRLRTLTLSEALMFYPFLGTETSLLTEFDVLFKAKGVESIENGCRVLCSLVLQSGEESEVVEFSKVASEDGVLAILQFVASRCKEPLNAVLTEVQVPVSEQVNPYRYGFLCLNPYSQTLSFSENYDMDYLSEAVKEPPIENMKQAADPEDSLLYDDGLPAQEDLAVVKQHLALLKQVDDKGSLLAKMQKSPESELGQMLSKLTKNASTSLPLPLLSALHFGPEPLGVTLEVDRMKSKRLVNAMVARQLTDHHLEQHYTGWLRVYTGPSDGPSIAAVILNDIPHCLGRNLDLHASSKMTELSTISLAVAALVHLQACSDGPRSRVVCSDSRAVLTRLFLLEKAPPLARHVAGMAERASCSRCLVCVRSGLLEAHLRCSLGWMLSSSKDFRELPRRLEVSRERVRPSRKAGDGDPAETQPYWGFPYHPTLIGSSVVPQRSGCGPLLFGTDFRAAEGLLRLASLAPSLSSSSTVANGGGRSRSDSRDRPLSRQAGGGLRGGL
ncbi:uncharacterized protein ISCGN_016188 [Ixodes scapularis]